MKDEDKRELLMYIFTKSVGKRLHVQGVDPTNHADMAFKVWPAFAEGGFLEDWKSYSTVSEIVSLIESSDTELAKGMLKYFKEKES